MQCCERCLVHEMNRDNDAHEILLSDGTKEWHFRGQLHREGEPAMVYANGDQMWCLNDKFHRVDGPAIVRANGDQEWFLNDKLHRVDGPAIVRANGEQEWFLEYRRHREDGPAIVYAHGTQMWWSHGKLHRVDGPAFIKTNGDQEWYLNGEKVPEWKVMLSKNCKLQIDTCPVCYEQTNCIQLTSCKHGICKDCLLQTPESCCICNVKISSE